MAVAIAFGVVAAVIGTAALAGAFLAVAEFVQRATGVVLRWQESKRARSEA